MCEEHEHLRDAYGMALSVFIEAGGTIPADLQDPKLAALWEKVWEAKEALNKHRKEHGC